jgi:hypothetical protein
MPYKKGVAMEINDIWADIFGSGYEYLDWIESVRFKDGADWDVAGTVVITYENPENTFSTLTEAFSVDEVLKAYKTIAESEYRHCGGCDILDPDVCTTDMVLQTLIFEDVIYG